MKDKQRQRLGNSEVRKIVSNVFAEQLERFLLENPTTAKIIVRKISYCFKSAPSC